MPPICLLGAAGSTGVLVASRLAEAGQPFVACGRDPARVRQRLRSVVDAVVDVRRVDVAEPETLDAALRGTASAISTIGPYERFGRPVVDAALRAGVHLVDVAGEPSYVRWVHESRADAAREAGVVLVAGAGFTGATGDLLAALAARAAGDGAELHVAYTTRGGGRAAWTSGTRRSVAGVIGRSGVAYVDRELVEDRPGEQRRLAWFPRPLGPMHAAAVPGVEAVTVPAHADVTSVRTYLAMSSWKAEVLQALANASRWPPIGRRMARSLDRDVDEPSAERRAATRWACVAEAGGPHGVARAWAYGTDPYGTAAATAVAIARRLARDETAAPGVRSAASLGDPAVLLDELAEHAAVRWSVARPDA